MPVNGPSYYGGTLMAPSISLSSRLRHRPTGPGDVLFQMEEYTLNKPFRRGELLRWVLISDDNGVQISHDAMPLWHIDIPHVDQMVLMCIN